MKESLPIERVLVMPSKSPKKVSEEKQKIELGTQNYWTMNKVLEMFGTEQAKQNFLDACEQYYEKLNAQKLSSIRGYSESEKGRAALHNKIMETLQKLSLAQKSNAENEKILFSLADRNKAEEMIKDYIEVKSSLKHPKLTKLGQMRLGKFH